MKQDDSENNFVPLARLKWACRRGMLELDVLLGNFLNEAYLTLEPADQQLFVELLTAADPELFSWLMGQSTPPNPGMIRIVELVRQHARNRI